MNVKTLAHRLGVAERTIYRACDQRRIEHMRIGRAIRFTDQQAAQAEAFFTIPIADPRAEIPNPTYTPDARVVLPFRRPA